MRIVLSEKQKQSIAKQQFEQGIDELGQSVKADFIKVWKEGADLDPLSSEALWTEIVKLTDINLYKVIKVDVGAWHEVFNILDEILSLLIDKLQADEHGKDQDVELKTLKLLKFSKMVLLFATNAQWYASTERITKLIDIYQKRTKQNFPMLEELISVLATLGSKAQEKKDPHHGDKLSQAQQDNIVLQEIRKLRQFCVDNIQKFYVFADLIINNQKSQVKQMEDMKLSDNDIVNQGKQQCQNEQELQQFYEDGFVVTLRCINLFLNTGDLNNNKRQFAQDLEQLIPPKFFVDKIIQILKNEKLSKRIHVQVINMFFLFVCLDLNVLLPYVEPTESPYYIQACNYPDLYTTILQQLSKYHAYTKLKSYKDHSMIDQETEDFINHQASYFDEEEDQDYEPSETIKSQKFLNYYLNFLGNLLNIKNRQLQNKLYPQLLKPLLAITVVKPINNIYQININIQVKAAKLLKDVVKVSSIDDPTAIEKIIERLKEELRNMHRPESEFKKSEDDDTESGLLLLYRQDLIRSLLRFLSFSIIRNDPNAINFTQNFIANSRKILDSQLIQKDMIQYIFEANKTLDKKDLINIIDPVILQCIQLISYLFNDLPQKIPQFVENGYFAQLVDSLCHRIPIQPETLTLIMKFVQTLCLNYQGAELIAASPLLMRIAELGTDAKAYKSFVDTFKAYQYKELIQSICLQNKEISKELYKSILKAYEIMVERAWAVTQQYIDSEKQKQDPNLSEEIKDKVKSQYERDQIQLEYCFEAVTSLLWIFAIDVIDEQQYMESNFIKMAIKDCPKETLDVLQRVITNPIVASACPNMFGPFNEVVHQMLSLFGKDFKIKFLREILRFIEIQCKNIHLGIGQNLEEVDDIEKAIKTEGNPAIVLSEIDQRPEKIEISEQLNGSDQMCVVFGKIGIYCEILRFTEQNMKAELLKEPNFSSIITDLFQIQSLVNRYHASKYERDINKDIERLHELQQKLPRSIIDDTDFKSFKLIIDPKSDEDEYRNLHFTYDYEYVSTFMDPMARLNSKTIIELQLDENISHTSNLCQIAVRKLIVSLLKAVNRKKIHHSEADQIDKSVIEYNQLIGMLIAKEYYEFKNVPLDSVKNEVQVMRYCCQFSAMFSEFNKVLFQSFSFGALLVRFFDERGLESVQALVLKIIEYLYNTEKLNKPISMNLCRNIQLLFSHVIDFFVQIMDAKYLDQQYNQFLIHFYTQSNTDTKQEYIIANKKLRKYFMNIYVQVLYFLFVDLNQNKNVTQFKADKDRISVFEYFDQISILFFESMLDIFYVMSKGLSNMKIFDVQPDLDMVRQLKNKGYREEQAIEALRSAQNDLNVAIKYLQGTEVAVNESIDINNVVQASIKDFICFMPNNPQSVRKNNVLENILFIIGKDSLNKKVELTLKKVRDVCLDMIQTDYNSNNYEKVGVLSYSLVCLMSYKKRVLLQEDLLFTAFEQLFKLHSLQIQNLKNKMSSKEIDDEKQITYTLQQQDRCLQLFLYIAEQCKISSDLIKTQNIVNPSQQQQVPNDKQIEDTLSQFKNQLEELNKLNETNIFYKNKEKTSYLLKQITLLIIEYFKSLHSMNPQLEKLQDFQVHEITTKAIEILNFLISVKGFPGFDCQSLFLQNDGLRSLFYIKSEFPLSTQIIRDNQFYERKKYTDMQVQSKILLQILCQNDQSQVKIYENLIKSVLFIHFQENYKQIEGQNLIKDLLIKEQNEDTNKISKSNTMQSIHSKKKGTATPQKSRKSIEDQNLASGTKSANISKQTKNMLFKKSEYGEILLSEFVAFFNNVMLIQDLKSFLIACQNVCTIKKKKPFTKKEPHEEGEKEALPKPTEENKNNEAGRASLRKQRRVKITEPQKDELPSKKRESQEKEDYYVTLSHPALKDMIAQTLNSQPKPVQSSNGTTQVGSVWSLPSNVDLEKASKTQIQKFQSEIVYQMLDIFMEQTRELDRMILNACAQKQNPTPNNFHLRLSEEGQLILKDPDNKLSNHFFLFDIVSILSHLTYILTHTPMLVQSLLLHKGGKTYNFIIRNLYYLLTLSIDYEKQLQPNEYQFYINNKNIQTHLKKLEMVSEFFKRVMLDNPHLTIHERKVKQDARLIFQREVLRNLSGKFKNGQIEQKFHLWPKIQLIYQIGALWLISFILKDEERDNITQQMEDKKLSVLVAQMQRYRNIIRSVMIKSLIFECQSKSDNGFQLLKQIEHVQNEIQKNLGFLNNQKEPIQFCITTVANILQPFENNNALWGDKDSEKIDQLGFLPLQEGNEDHPSSMIDEDMNEDEDEDENEESSGSSDDFGMGDDDDLLDSDGHHSQRNFRYSDHEGHMGNEEDDDDAESYDDEMEDDDDMDSEGDQGGEQNQLRNLGDLLGGGDEGLDLDIEYGDEDDESDYYSDFEEVGEESSQEVPASQRQSRRSNEQQPDEEQQNNNEAGVGQPSQAPVANNDDDYGDEQYGDEDDYHSEDLDDFISEDEYYDEGSYEDEYGDEDVNNEIEIFIGRDPNNADRLSLQDFNNRGGGPGPRGTGRRDDILSLNNMSVDMFNINQNRGGGLLGRGRQFANQSDAIPESTEEIEVEDFLNSQQNRHEERAALPQVIRAPQAVNNDIGGVIHDILSLIMNRRGGQVVRGDPRDVVAPTVWNTFDETSYRPIETLLDIVEINKEIQKSIDIYRCFIREAVEHHPQQSTNSKQSKAGQDMIELKNNRFEQIGGPQPRFNMNPFAQSSEQINTATNVDTVLDGMDPEFLDALDTTGVQNLADTEAVIQRITNQNRQDGPIRSVQSAIQFINQLQNREQRIAVLRGLPEDVFRNLPSDLYNEGLSYRNLQRAAQQNQFQQSLSNVLGNNDPSPNQRMRGGLLSNVVVRATRGTGRIQRDRIMSFDSQLNDITDFSRGVNDPFINDQEGGKQIGFQKDLSIRNNSLYNNFNQYLESLIIGMQSESYIDSQGKDLNKITETIIQQQLLPPSDLQIIQDYGFSKVQGLVNMVMTWIKFLTNGAFIMQKETTLMKILMKIPLVRQGVLVNIFQWMAHGINELENNFSTKPTQQNNLLEQLKVERGNGLPGKISVLDLVHHCLRCYKQIIYDASKRIATSKATFDIVKVPSTDLTLNFLVQFINLQQSEHVKQHESLLEQIIDRLVMFNKLNDKIKDQFFNSIDSDPEEWFGEIISTLQTIFKQLSVTYSAVIKASNSEEQQKNIVQITFSKQMIDNLGKLLLSKEVKMKDVQRDIKAIFFDVSQMNESSQLLIDFFRDSLSKSLVRFVEIIGQDHLKIDLDVLKKEVVVINQILKIAKVNSKQESNICEEHLFFTVVEKISALLDRKHSESLNTTAQQAFIFREEFRTIMITLFTLFEYNLKFIFTESADDLMPQSKNRRQQNRRGSLPANNQQQNSVQVTIQDVEEIKNEIATQRAPPSKERHSLNEAIDEHLSLKIKDEKVREDQRLKVFVKFCLEHKRIINNFIRANQQVLNESLRNVLMKVPQILDFDNKRLMFRSQIKKIQRKYRSKYIDLQVRRDKVFEDSFEQLKNVASDRWKGHLNVEFVDEQGIDEGGLTREWFMLLSQEIFNPDLALFLQSNAGSTYYPNPQSVVQPEYLQLFKFIGRIVGKALLEQQLLDCYFVKALYKIILGLPLNYHDVEDYDNEIYKNLKWCLDNNVEFLGLTFTESRDFFGKTEEVEIKANGRNEDVTEDNKYEYVQLMAYQKLYNAVQKQVDSFLLGFYEIIPKALIQLFDNRELEMLISGLPNIDIEDLKENTIYQNYTADSPVIKWLFEVLEEFENSERAEFLQFVTGSSKVPVEGFKGLRGARGIQKFQVVKFFTNDVNRLPQAHTCFKQLELPEYQSKDQLKERLLTAIKEGKTFGFA